MNDNHYIPDEQERAEQCLDEAISPAPPEIIPTEEAGLPPVGKFVDFSNAPLTKDQEPEPFNISEELQKAIDATTESLRARSYALRNNLGKMINCRVCTRRHYGNQCVPVYAVDYIEEDVETGEKTTIYRMAAQNTRKGVMGAAAFAKKRLRPHLNQRKLQFIERVRSLFGNGTFDPESKEYKRALAIARRTAKGQLDQERRDEADTRRRMQDVSRRINQGLLPAGTQSC